MNPQKETLSEALRELAAASPQVSLELGARLEREFTRHHAHRRLRNHAVFAVGLAACLAISAALLRTGKPTTTAKTVEQPSQTAKEPAPEPKTAATSKSPKASAPPVAMAKAAAKSRTHRETTEARKQIVEPPAMPAAGDFIALPTFDPAIPPGPSRIVRVNMTGSALQLIGYPVDGQLLDRRILTDVLVGQDGMPYAVRFVQARNVR